MDTTVPIGERDPSLSVANGCPVDHTQKSLADQAKGLGRPAVMKEIVGPEMTDFLRSLYEEELSSEEVRNLHEISYLRDIPRFYKDLRTTVSERFGSLLETDAGQERYDDMVHLSYRRTDLFYYHDEDIYLDGIRSNISIPLALATDIYRIEKFGSEMLDSYDARWGFQDVEPEDLAKIMERPEFDEMLMSLTKGPNGFLVTGASINIIRNAFFGFDKPDDRLLDITEAYEVEDGKVVGLSDQYHISANIKRREIKENQEKYGYGKLGHRYADSSGCPVRHRFPDSETGEPQESLIITAKKFLVAALRASQKQPEQETA